MTALVLKNHENMIELVDAGSLALHKAQDGSLGYFWVSLTGQDSPLFYTETDAARYAREELARAWGYDDTYYVQVVY